MQDPNSSSQILDASPVKRDFSYTQNRELSWLQFNRRVLEESLDTSVPLYERLKFIAIFESNLDEFFMVRVGSLTDLAYISPTTRENKSNMTAGEQLDAVFASVKPLVKLREKAYQKVVDELAAYGFNQIDLATMPKKDRKFARDYYRNYVAPILSPQVVDDRHPFPHLKNKERYIVSHLTDEEGNVVMGITPIPDNLSDYIFDPDSPLSFVRIEELIRYNIDKLFDIYTVGDSVVISVTRNADISFDEEKFADDDSDFRLRVSRLLKKRMRLNPVRLEIQGDPPKELKAELMQYLGLQKNQIYTYTTPLSLQGVFDFERQLTPALKSELCYEPFSPRASLEFDSNGSVFDQIVQRDRILFYPYDSIEPFLRFLHEAAHDPDVVSIKITLYRLARDSRVAQHLIEAAENGKDVTVLMELRARFDEANNIDWSQHLEEAGCNIIYGMEHYKCHSKICLVTRQEQGKISNYVQIGTGNYNEKTARLYTDLSFFTANESIGRDAVDFFQNMLIGNLNGAYSDLLVAPANMKHTLISLIEREIAKGEEGRILLKANSVTERDIIDKLSEASRAGVQVKMNIRGICCLLPGVEGKTDTIHVRSIVGRFLEHSRIYCFGSGDDCEMYISSADLMTRNLVHRVEIAVPLRDPDIKTSVLGYLDLLLADNVKARTLMVDGSYAMPERAEGEADLSCQKQCKEQPLQKIEEKPLSSSGPRVRRSARRDVGASSSSGLPPVGQRTLWQRIKAVFLGD